MKPTDAKCLKCGKIFNTIDASLLAAIRNKKNNYDICPECQKKDFETAMLEPPEKAIMPKPKGRTAKFFRR